MKPYCVTILMEDIEQYFQVVVVVLERLSMTLTADGKRQR